MNVKIDNESKKWITLEELSIAKEIAKDLKEEDIKRDVEMACYCIVPYGDVTVYSATAKIARNQRIYNFYKDYSGHLDIWINFVAYIDGIAPMFVKGGIYLSDAWKVTPNTRDETMRHMYIQTFTKH